jgi:hypothetical protein
MSDVSIDEKQRRICAWLASIADRDFPSIEEIRNKFPTWEEGDLQVALLGLLDAGPIGMDGFRFCWPMTAKRNLRKKRSLQYVNPF